MAANAILPHTESHQPPGSALPGDPLFRCDRRMFLVSALILYLELVLIRWIGTEIPVFAYLGNLILVVCFFGVGLGCYRSARPPALTRLGVNLLLLTVLVANPFHCERLDLRQITDWLAGFEDSPLWGSFETSGRTTLTALLIVWVVVYLIVFTFVPLGQILGRTFGEHPRVVRAYSVNIAGSLAGIWLFNSLSWLCTSPVTWFAVVMALLAALGGVMRLRRPWFVLASGAAILCVWWARTSSIRTLWSPYQKLQVTPVYYGSGTNQVLGGYSIDANGLPYQGIVNLSRDFLGSYPQYFDVSQARYSHYNLAFEFKRNIHRILIVGAGAGNNAAAALRHGVEQVDCVEIDPQIYALGKELHPERPYDSPRVRMYLTDARAFLKQADGPYDMIWFGLLDTHPGSSYNNRRVDHYVYTIQCLQEAHRLLTPDGVLLMNFCARRWWISDRLHGMVTQVFGHKPVAFHVDPGDTRYGAGGELTLLAGNLPLSVDDLPAHWVQEYVKANEIHPPDATRATTDDWPYLYLERAKIPKLHLVVSLTILGAVVLAYRRLTGADHPTDWHFFALGAAFLLLEVQTVSRATLLFGMTWVVNAIVISAVLVMILLSNLVAWRWPRFPQWVILSGLGVTVAALAVVPLDWLNGLPYATKLIVASGFLTAPVFFAGLIFIQSFAACTDKARALGSNLIGALVGGLLESVSFVTGIRALVILVGAFYLFAILRRPAAVRR
ncbi:MAG: spermidine synthase [Verrucomicrobiia bacterium]